MQVWDMRSKNQIHSLCGHENTVSSLLTQATDPQVITGAMDSQVKVGPLSACEGW
jgi:pleiotropic regulator 1